MGNILIVDGKPRAALILMGWSSCKLLVHFNRFNMPETDIGWRKRKQLLAVTGSFHVLEWALRKLKIIFVRSHSFLCHCYLSDIPLASTPPYYFSWSFACHTPSLHLFTFPLASTPPFYFKLIICLPHSISSSLHLPASKRIGLC